MSTYNNPVELHSFEDKEDIYGEPDIKKKNTKVTPIVKVLCAFSFAIFISVSIVATGYVTYLLMKTHYDGCLKGDDIPSLQINKKLHQPKDCKGHYMNGALEDGIYRISIGKSSFIYVQCDMINGGWTVIERRLNGKETFDRGWSDYIEGFGNLSSDHWMGLKYQHLLLANSEKRYRVCFEFLFTDSKTTGVAIYNSYYVSSEEFNFTMTVSSIFEQNSEMKKHIGIDDFFEYYNGVPFTTRDVDNDFREEGNCVDLMKCGGYWYKNCHMLCINGPFDRMYFFGKANKPTFFLEAVVKIRPIS